MTALLIAATVIAGAGAIAALAPLDIRLGLIGLTAALVGAALIADPLPDPAVLAVRLSAALLVVVLLRAAATALESRGEARGDPRGEARGAGSDRGPRGWSGRVGGSEIGWPAAVLLGAAGAVAGLAIGLDTALDGWAAASLTLAGLLVASALGPILAEVAGLRRAMAAILMTEAVILVRNALVGHVLVGSTTVLDEVVFAGLIVVVAAAGVALALAAAGRGPSALTESARVARAAARPNPRPAARRP